MNFAKATNSELLTVMFWDAEASPVDQDQAAREYVKRELKKQKPKRRHNQRMKKVYPR